MIQSPLEGSWVPNALCHGESVVGVDFGDETAGSTTGASDVTTAPSAQFMQVTAHTRACRRSLSIAAPHTSHDSLVPSTTFSSARRTAVNCSTNRSWTATSVNRSTAKLVPSPIRLPNEMPADPPLDDARSAAICASRRTRISASSTLAAAEFESSEVLVMGTHRS